MPDRISNTLIYVYDYRTVLKRFQQLFEDFLSVLVFISNKCANSDFFSKIKYSDY